MNGRGGRFTSARRASNRAVVPKKRTDAASSPKVGPPSTPAPAPAPSRRWTRIALGVLAGAYLVTVWLDGVGSSVPGKTMPRAWVYFAQVAALFPHAAEMAIDYRAEGWSCSEKKWIEIDVRPWFQLEANTKENRFERVLYFYRQNRTVMRALEDFVVKRHNEASTPRIGGVRFLSLRIPFPPPGSRVEPWSRRPVATYGKDQRHDWYWTPRTRRDERCGARSEGDDDDPKSEGTP
jgi:hypothetical protein